MGTGKKLLWIFTRFLEIAEDSAEGKQHEAILSTQPKYPLKSL